MPLAMSMPTTLAPFTGVFPIAPTPFTASQATSTSTGSAVCSTA